MSDVAIRVENISKRYTIGKTSSGSLRETIAGLFSKDDSGNTEEFYALRDVSFEVKRGEAIGVIGKNGAGKSTLLKILSRITEPTTGRIEIDGRVSSLLEVGTGFHPELTGRENVFLNGTILGMSRTEVKRKFDEIVDFSGVEKFLDTPVKRYSSGMTVRLAFAVAAHLEPEILIIDEVLAVGDAEFQKKCLGKMEDVAGEGRTVLFVSHNMGAVQNLCKKCVFLKNGKVAQYGDTPSIVDTYIGGEAEASGYLQENVARSGSGKAYFIDFYTEDTSERRISQILNGQDIFFVFVIKIDDSSRLDLDVGFSIHDTYDTILSVLYTSYQKEKITTQSQGNIVIVKCLIRDFSFGSGTYKVGGRIVANNDEADWPANGIGKITVENGDFYHTGHLGFASTPILIKGKWHHYEEVTQEFDC